MDKTDLLIETNTIADMIHHPALMEFCVHLLPRPENAQSNLALRDVGKLMPWHSHVQPQVVLQAVNRLITDRLAGKEVFYSFYIDDDNRANDVLRCCLLLFMLLQVTFIRHGER